MPVRAKFSVGHVSQDGHINMQPVYTGSEENKAFFQATPSGAITFYATRPDVRELFKPGAEFYVDFTEATPAPAQAAPETAPAG